MTRTRRPSLGSVATRYIPAVAVLLVVVVVALLVGGGDDAARVRPAKGPTALPLTFDEARARGVDVAWGPHCDTSTGKVAVPLWYAPPCVDPSTGDGSGADKADSTSPGVTRNEIVVAVYQQQPDLLEQTFLERSGSDESLDSELRTNQQYVDFFEANYETYGRHVRLVPVRGSGPPDDDVSAKADAIQVATEIGAFASFGGPSQTTAYADELAARGVLCVGDCTTAAPESFLRSRSPYVWPTLASPEQAAEHWSEFVGKELSGRKAKYAGDRALAKQTRRFGVVRYDDEPGTFDRSFARFADLLRTQHVRIATEVPYQLDLADAQEGARATIAALREAHVTSVIIAGDPVFPVFLTKEATAQGYFPEWVVMGYAYTDTAVFGREYDQRQWAHAFGVSLLPTRQADDIDELAQIVVWQTGLPPEASTFRILVQAQLLFFTGVHLAGPDLTPETFRAGLFRFPATRPTSSPFLHLSWGRHRIWPGVDLTGGDDATVIFWDPDARGPDEVGNAGRGLWHYALEGRRYLPGHWPNGDVGLFDDATAATILEELPPAARPPDYPSPASTSSQP
ncbi:MAG: ABC transporter substrate-binding protein [Acidimicrobiia bacterium]|nr:ABC transporter substrate-binding protein [Acidimicrobiia bacterium]